MKNNSKDIDAAVKRVVSLAHMNFGDEKRAEVVEKIETILNYVAQLNELNVENVEPTSHAVNFQALLREDVVVSSNTSDQIISQFPERYEKLVKVPKVIDGE